jgi:hypothetical protein
LACHRAKSPCHDVAGCPCQLHLAALAWLIAPTHPPPLQVCVALVVKAPPEAQ